MNKLFPHGRWLQCAPRFFEIDYEINPWMHLEVQPDHDRAKKQWQELHHTLIRLGAWIDYIKPERGLPDMVFTANGGLVSGKKCVLPRFHHKERQPETPKFSSWFRDHGYELHMPKNGNFEGEGDAFIVGETLFAGCGFRSECSVYKEISEFLGVPQVVMCELVDDRFYHLDTCFCPLNAARAIYFPGAFADESRKEMSKHIELIEVSESDAQKFACNSVVLGNNIVMPAGCDATMAKLKELGFTSYPVEVDEFRKAGGAAKCLSLRI